MALRDFSPANLWANFAGWIIFGVLVVLLMVIGYWGIYLQGRNSMAPKVTAAESSKTTSQATGANLQGTLKIEGERQRLDIVVRQQAAESVQKIEERGNAGDLDGAVTEWGAAIDGLREPPQYPTDGEGGEYRGQEPR